jgi:hypothetical protein
VILLRGRLAEPCRCYEVGRSGFGSHTFGPFRVARVPFPFKTFVRVPSTVFRSIWGLLTRPGKPGGTSRRVFIGIQLLSRNAEIPRSEFQLQNYPSTAPRGAPAGLALQARPVAHEGKIRAFGAGFADIALHPRFGAFLGDPRNRLYRLGPAQLR